MHQILLLGAGKSATCLIDYLLENGPTQGWFLTLGDVNEEAARTKLGNSTHGRAVSIDIENEADRKKFIAEADIVISLLPPSLHYQVALTCIDLNKNLLTASYVDERLKALSPTVDQKGLLFLCEMGLDPGIDHMSAMKIIDQIHRKGGRVKRFLSHCGGLVAPESDNNPWHYKISWNPRNIILAGQAGAVFKENGRETSRSYAEVFSECPELNLPGLPQLAWYPNRDSLAYIPLYHLEEASTFIRTTLRYSEFCKAWNGLVQGGLTTDDDQVAPGTTYQKWSSQILSRDWEANRDAYVFLGLNDELPIPSLPRSSASILQELAEQKLKLNPEDKDMIVMVHEFEYEIAGQSKYLTSHLVVKGKDHLRTAMAKTVGLPLGIAAKLILNGNIMQKGLCIPTSPEIYEPVLADLEKEGINFAEHEK